MEKKKYIPKRNFEVRIKLSREEHGIIKHKSNELGMSISAFLRCLGLKSNIITG